MSFHPSIGQFVQRDRLQYVDGMNPYLREQANPLNRVDPTGMEPEWLFPGEIGDPDYDDGNSSPSDMTPTPDPVWLARVEGELAAALGSLCSSRGAVGGGNGDCPCSQSDCSRQASLIAGRIAWAVGQEVARGRGSLFGGWWGNRFRWLTGSNDCGAWQRAIYDAISTIPLDDRRCFAFGNADDSGTPVFSLRWWHQHHWIIIRRGTGFVHVDPWPSGGGTIDDGREGAGRDPVVIWY